MTDVVESLAEQIIIDLERNPESWSIPGYRLSRYAKNDAMGFGKGASLEIWVGQGPFFYKIMGSKKRRFTLFEKIKLWCAIRRWLRRPLKEPLL